LELDTTSALEMSFQTNISYKKESRIGFESETIGQLEFCFVLVWFSWLVDLNKAFKHFPFRARLTTSKPY
jgi:hypothetical protein